MPLSDRTVTPSPASGFPASPDNDRQTGLDPDMASRRRLRQMLDRVIQRLRLDRHSQVRGAAGLQAGIFAAAIGFPGHDDDRNILRPGMLLDRGQQVHAGQPGQMQFRDDGFRQDKIHDLKRFFGTGGGVHIVGELLQQHPGAEQLGRIAVDKENDLFHRIRRLHRFLLGPQRPGAGRPERYVAGSDLPWS